ncbi:MAG: glycoside hydrolase family 9 protein [Sedimentisphaerales bacterium]
MKTIKYLIAIIFLTLLSRPVIAAEEAIGINFFDLAHTDAGSPTCWGSGKGYAWVGSPTTFLNCTGGTNGGDVPVSMSMGAGSLVFTTTRPGGGGWCNIQFKLDAGHSVNFLRYGSDPMLYLRLKWGAIASGSGFTIQLYDDYQIWNSYYIYAGLTGPYSSYHASINLSNYVTPSTTDWQDVYIPMSDFLANNHNLDLTRISFIEISATGNYSATNTLYIEKMKIIPDIANQYTDMVKVNQLGYLPNQRKLAIVSYEAGTVSPAPTYFQVKDASTGSVVYQANLQLKTPCTSSWNQSGDTVYHADFTSFTTPGRYVIYCPELGQTSPAFDIANRTFDEPFRDALRFFYYARSAQEIAEPSAEDHTRPAIYTNNTACAYDYDDNDSTHRYDYDPNNQGITTRDVAGGWFDAGDLHLDIHNNVTTMWFLLEMLEQQYNKLGPRVLNLPESDGQTNDLVLLIKWELDWFKKMQNPDGSVHFIVISETSDQSRQEVSDISTGAACILAGTFAKAYTLLSNIPSMQSYASDLLSRAQLSWTWLTNHTSPSNYNPKDMYGNTWSYGITSSSSFRQYAAIELYIATGDSTYRTYFESRFSSANTDMQGITAIGKGEMDYAETTRPVSSTIRTAIRAAYTTLADTLVANANCSPYRIPIQSTGDITWGSSGLIACYAYTLLRVYAWTGNTTYRDTALDALEWISGRNPVSRVFITGYGDYLHGTDIYSFYWFDHTNPVPGYLCGNVNAYDFLYNYIKYPWKYYMNIQNASTLEPCLPWQAEACYLFGYFADNLNLTADFNLDGTVNYLDLLTFSQAWLTTPADPGWNPNCDIAVPHDNIINFLDFAVFANQWMSQ